MPILVLGGVNNIAMSHTLQSLLKQPGLDKSKVYVAYSVMFGDDYKPFIELFGFNTISVMPVSKYVGESHKTRLYVSDLATVNHKGSEEKL